MTHHKGDLRKTADAQKVLLMLKNYPRFENKIKTTENEMNISYCMTR